MTATLITLALIFSELSLLAFGGGNAILPEIERQVVTVHHWLSAREFSALFALSQAAPGPNLMIVTLIGWRVAGFYGVLVTTLAKFGPSSLLAIVMLDIWERFKDKPWRRYVQAGLLPVTVGLVAASAALITHASVENKVEGAITVATAAIALKTKIHPLWLLLGGAIVGLLCLNFS